MTASEAVHFHFDPLCPWAWITSRWAARLEELGALEIEWRLFSLGVANLPEGESVPSAPVGPSGSALELLAGARRLAGNSAVSKLYTTMGTAAHVRHEKLSDSGVLDRTWTEAGLDPDSHPSPPSSDPTLWQEVLRDHRAAVAACQAFGVPTLILDGGAGPGIFGPVITQVPSDEESRELLQDVLHMVRRSYFFELKRDRNDHPPQTGG
ncbi:MAG TPA: DsbA family protein [Candidatus Dormibacteraeota bacterium]|nr:DsbA family protein [Candidatus Dormibacteraeota bacterium]